MNILKISKYPVTGWSIVAKKINKKDYLKLQSLIRKLNLKRNIKLEKKIKELSRKGKSSTPIINRIYSKLEYSYLPKEKLLSLSWTGKNYNGYELASLWLSN